MTIFIALYLFFLTWLLLNGLFNEPWRRDIQYIVDGVTNKRVFWHLMGKDGFAVPTVFLLYVTHIERNEFTGCLNYASGADERLYDHHISKTVISKRLHALKNVSKLNREIERREKEIVSLLSGHEITSLHSNLVKAFDSLKEQIYMRGTTPQDDRIFAYFSEFFEENETGVELWRKRKKLSEHLCDLEWETGDKRVPNIDSLEATYVECGAVYRKVVCESFQGDSEALRILLQEWEQLKMLEWCISDFTAWTMDKNRMQTGFWRLIVNIFL